MNIKKIIILGNSVALRNRPHNDSSLNYGQIIEKKINTDNEQLYLVNNLAIGSQLIIDLRKNIDSVINQFGDLYIINMGVCDAATREYPLWYFRVLNNKKFNFINKVFKFFKLHLFSKFRPLFVVLRGKRTWVNKRTYAAAFSHIIDKIKKNTSGKILCLSILHPNDRIKKQIPGSEKSYSDYNSIMAEICKKNNIPFLDLSFLNSADHYPDGTHFNQQGNTIVADMILDYIKKDKLI